jgi:outer membrane lipoprotein
MRKSWSFCLLIGLLLAGGGCGPSISTALQREAGPQVDFAALSAHPDRYRGRLMILGGEVIGATPWNNGSLLIGDQRQLDERLFPVDDTSGGTFVVESDQWLNPNSYVPKSKVVVAGVAKGQKNGLPLLKAREIKLLAPPTWEKFYYPVPRDWYPPEMAYWYTPPYFDPYFGAGWP